MRINSRIRGRTLVWAVLTLMVSLSDRAQAQQSGLFPLAPIRRERPPCANEDPVYKYYKQQYFGYHPTNWRRFPGGWGVPSKEAPDQAAAFREQPLGNPPERGEGEEGPGGPGMGPAPDAGRPAANLPPERDPFEMENGPPGANPLPRGNQAPQTIPPRTRSPFDDAPQGAAIPSRRSPRARTATPIPRDGGPELSAPAAEAEPAAGARTTAVGADDDAMARGNEGPLLAIDDIDVSRSANVGSLFDSDPIQPAAPASTSNSTSTTQPPPRRGFISSLFGGLGNNWFRH